MKFLHTTIITIAFFALAGCGGSKSEPPTGLPAARKAPSFSSAAANDFVKNLSQTANDFASALKAKDVKTIKTIVPKLSEILKTRHDAAKGLPPAEVRKLRSWTNAIMRQLKKVATEVGIPTDIKGVEDESLRLRP